MRRCEKMSMMSFNSYSYEEHVLSIDIYVYITLAAVH